MLIDDALASARASGADGTRREDIFIFRRIASATQPV
jgi:hypothetical protein